MKEEMKRAVIGMSTAAATNYLFGLGAFGVRVYMEDGVAQLITPDFNPERFNLIVNGGIVTDCTFG